MSPNPNSHMVLFYITFPSALSNQTASC